MKPCDPPPPTYAFDYRHRPPSGNAINGLGESAKRPARHVFHRAGSETLAWQALDDFFSLINPWGVVKHMLANTWQLRRQDGPVAEQRVAVPDTAAMAQHIKAESRRLGAALVGIAPVGADALYENCAAPFAYAICLGLPMDRDEMLYAPQARAAVEVMRSYREISRIAIELGDFIRALGWPARAYGNPNSTDILHIPLASAAGLGQLGKHGSLISEEHGSNFRLAAVLTDLPLALDAPVDIGVEDLCLSCTRCVDECPPQAIFNDKQLVRGESTWYVDFDKCVPYFVKTYGCAICIEVCPWSEPGRGPSISRKLLARRERRSFDQES